MVDAETLLRPRAILFDWDNTLIDSWAVIHEAQNAVLEAFGHPCWSLEETRSRVRGSMRDAYPALFGDRWEEAGKLFYESYRALHLERLVPLPGAERMLEELSGGNIYLGVVSNKHGLILRQESAHLGWDRLFGGLVGATDAVRDKPAAEPVLMALAASGIATGPDVWFVGDTDIDLHCAQAAGCVGVLLRPESPAPEEFAGCPPRLHFADCQTLSKYVARL
jgi:phosphoglycolate phosphatase